MREVAVFLCDYSGIMAQPWLEAGYDVILVDPQHPCGVATEGAVTKIGHIIDDPVTWHFLRRVIGGGRVAFVAGFPVCTDLAISGTVRWKEKREVDIHFQAKAMQLVHECRIVGELSGAPYMFENPVSAISSIYRKPDYTFHPNEYGGYLPLNDRHPLYPEYYPPRDAYGKKTCLWTGGGFRMPTKKQSQLRPNSWTAKVSPQHTTNWVGNRIARRTSAAQRRAAFHWQLTRPMVSYEV